MAVLGSLEAAWAATHTAETEGRPGVPRRVPCEQGSQVRATSRSDRQLATCLGRAADACEARLQLAGPAECGVSGSVRGVCARHGLARGAEPLRLAPALNGHCVRCCRARGAARASWAAATTMATAVRGRGGTWRRAASQQPALPRTRPAQQRRRGRCTRGAKRAFGKRRTHRSSRDLRFEKGPLMGGLIYTIS